MLVETPMHPHHQLAMGRLYLESGRLVHAAFKAAGRVGTDSSLLYVLGAVIAGGSGRRAPHTSGLARHLGMPRGKVRRKLDQLVHRGLVRPEGQHYATTEKTLDILDSVTLYDVIDALPRLAQMIWGAADTLSATKDRSKRGTAAF